MRVHPERQGADGWKAPLEGAGPGGAGFLNDSMHDIRRTGFVVKTVRAVFETKVCPGRVRQGAVCG